MQPIEHDGTSRMIERFDPVKLKAHLDNPEIAEVRVFKIRKGMKIKIYDTLYKCTAARPNGKVTLKLLST